MSVCLNSSSLRRFGCDWYDGRVQSYAGERLDEMPTTGTHRLRSLSHSYSLPSSVSRMNLSSSRENETRGSSSNAEGDWGNPVW